MTGERLHVVTGGPGAGKTTLVAALAAAGIATAEETGRRIIRAEVAAGGTALPWDDAARFAARMLEAEIAAHDAALARGAPVVLDRGIPDVIGFLRLCGLPVPAAADRAARTLRYNARVFVAPFWPAIYAPDAERRQTPEAAAATEAAMRATYADYGYETVDLPHAPVAGRVAFVRARL